ncbi:MAG: hypothetical protein ACW99G_14305 [Candidatus Thorarchaeota archaeon]
MSFKSNNVKVKDLPKELEDLYTNAEKLSVEIMKLFFAMRQVPYVENKDGTTVEITDKDMKKVIKNHFGSTNVEKRKLIKEFADIIFYDPSKTLSSEKKSNFHSIMFKEGSTSGVSVKTKAHYKIMKKAIEEKWTKAKLIKELKPRKVVFATFSKDEWEAYLKEGDLDSFHEELKSRALNDYIVVGKKLVKLGLFPLNLAVPYCPKLYSAVLYEVIGRIRSWVENQKRLEEETKKRKSDYLNQLEYEKKLYPLFKLYVSELEDDDLYLTKKTYDTLYKCLEKHKKYEKGDKKGKQPDLADPLFDILKKGKYKALMQVKLDAFRSLNLTYVKEGKFQKMKDDAQVTFPDKHKSPFKLAFSFCGRGYRFSASSSDLGAFNFVVKIPDGECGVSCFPSGYFKRLRDVNFDQEDNRINLDFEHRGETLSTYFKEIHFMLKKTKKGTDYYFNVPFAFEEEEIEEEVIKATYDKIASTNTTRNKKLVSKKKDLVVLGIDLGINPIMAYSVMTVGHKEKGKMTIEIEGSPDSSFVDQGQVGGTVDDIINGRIVGLSARSRALCDYIQCSKMFRDKRPMHVKQKESMLRSVGTLGITHQATNHEKRKSLIASLVKGCKTEFKKLKTELGNYDHKKRTEKNWSIVPTEVFAMLALVDDVKSLMRSWNRYNWSIKDARRYGNIHETELAKYVVYRNNLKKDFLNKLGKAIIDLCADIKEKIGRKVDIIVIEKFDFVDYDDTFKKKKDNRLTSLFSPKDLCNKIEQITEEIGVKCVKVDHRYTSQLSVVDNSFGFRDLSDHKTKFYYEYDGKLYRYNCDIMASMNLVKRFVTHNSHVPRVNAVPLGDGTFLVTGDGQYQKAFFMRTIKKPYALLKPNGSTWVLEGITLKDKKKLEKEKKFKSKQKFYNHNNDVWVDLDGHYGIKNSFKAKVNKNKRKVKILC